MSEQQAARPRQRDTRWRTRSSTSCRVFPALRRQHHEGDWDAAISPQCRGNLNFAREDILIMHGELDRRTTQSVSVEGSRRPEVSSADPTYMLANAAAGYASQGDARCEP